MILRFIVKPIGALKLCQGRLFL